MTNEKLPYDVIEVNGVKYQRIVEEPKPQTLERIITECMIAYNNTVIVELMERILDRVEVEFFPKLASIEPPLYGDGWEDCIKELKTRLRE
jgi:molybdopterin converting factor small subunit